MIAQSPTPEKLAEMKRLLTPDGLKELQAKTGSLQLVQGVLPFDDGKKYDGVIDGKPVEDIRPKAVYSLPTAEYMLFTLAPVYYIVKVPFDILSQFQQSEHGQGSQVQHLHVKFPVTPDIPGWENMVSVINKESWENLVRFLGECAFQRKNHYWTICGDMINVPLSSGGIMPLAVFTPRGLAIRLRPQVDEKGAVRFHSEDVFENPKDSDYARKLINFSMEDAQ
jgi:hypothetical protein